MATIYTQKYKLKVADRHLANKPQVSTVSFHTIQVVRPTGENFTVTRNGRQIADALANTNSERNVIDSRRHARIYR